MSVKASKLLKDSNLRNSFFPVDFQKFISVNPHNNQIKHEKSFDSFQEIQAKLENAHLSFRKNKTINLSNRIEKFDRLVEVLKKEKENLAILMTEEMGKPLLQAYGEVDKTINHILYYQNNLEQFLQNSVAENKTHVNTSIRQASGTILVISPFNFPLWVPFKIVVPSLMLGNSVLHKPAPSLSLTSAKIAQIMYESGFANSYQITCADKKGIEQIIKDEKITGVNFTGSTEVGRTIAKLSGENLKKTVLELGGSDPFLVLKDADIDLAVQHAVEGRIRNNGQACICAKRIILDSSIEDEFVSKLTSHLDKLKIGNPLDKSVILGPLARFDLFLKLIGQTLDAENQGAHRIYGDYADRELDLTKGNYFNPIILKGLPKSSHMYKEEFFGPVFNIFSSKSEEEAVTLANDTPYGLGASIFTKDQERGLALASQIESGSVFLNSATVSSSDSPSGGIKSSGIGRTCGKEGALEFTQQRLIGIFKH